jgi:DeoR family transcriptional regulator, fructose operon transcriptional repressor
MYAEERQSQILEAARGQGRVDNLELAQRFGVTPETIRRDLRTLERHGVLRRVHGGAIPVERISFEPAVAERSLVQQDEKVRIAEAALAEVPDEGAVLFDSGTTTAQLAERLPAERELTVITNSLSIGLSLAMRRRITVLTLGGRVRGRTFAAVDAWALRALDDLYVDVAFIGTNGLSVERGLTTPDPAEAEVKRRMIERSRRAVVLADHTKWGADHLVRFAEIDAVDLVVTDHGVDLSLLAAVRAAGPMVVAA